MKDKKVLKIILKLVVTAASLYISFWTGFLIILFGLSENINMILTYAGALLLPLLLVPIIWAKKKKRAFKWWGILFLILAIWLAVELGIDAYNASITIDTNPNINCNEYLPFKEDSKIVKLDKEASLLLEERGCRRRFRS